MKLVIDPGHGGKDPGAIGNGLQEKNIVLDISLRIRRILVKEYEGVEVRLTRETDVYLDHAARVKIANDWGANYYLSVHVNAGGGTGFESFVHSSQTAASVATQNVIHTEIMRSMPSITDRGKKNRNFAVLREAKMPAILTEVLFIDNPIDAAKLKDSAFLEAVARGHVSGLEKAFGLKKKNSTGVSTQEQFIAKITPIAQKLRLEGSPIFPSIRIAQSALETGWKIPSWNNLGGYKVGSGKPNEFWKGEVISKGTWEVYDGKRIDIETAFRAYDSIDDFFRDQDLLFGLARYQRVREAKTQKEQANALYQCGYATDPLYAQKILSIVDRYDLERFDVGMLKPEDANKIIRYLSASWFVVQGNKEAEAEFNRLANELRKASGQEEQ